MTEADAGGKGDRPAASKGGDPRTDALPVTARPLPLDAPPSSPERPAGLRPAPDRALQDLWVQRLRRRDPEALREVIGAFTERLAAVAVGILHDRDAVEDALQETFTRAWLRIDAFHGDAGLYTWLYRIAVNACKDHLKRRRRRPAASLEAAGAETLLGPGAAPLEGLERREERLRVHAAIARLPEPFRTVLALREIDGMTYDDIATVLGVRPGTVESRLFRARKRLGALLGAGRRSEA